jgi:hypothetical protein
VGTRYLLSRHQTRWAQQATKATVGTTFAAKGTKALHIPPFTKGRAQIRETKTLPALAKAFYARVYLYVDKQPTEVRGSALPLDVDRGERHAR